MVVPAYPFTEGMVPFSHCAKEERAAAPKNWFDKSGIRVKINLLEFSPFELPIVLFFPASYIQLIESIWVSFKEIVLNLVGSEGARAPIGPKKSKQKNCKLKNATNFGCDLKKAQLV